MEPKKTVYYTDPLRDDFAGTDINQQCVDETFSFQINNPLWLILEWIVYYLIAFPLVWLIAHIGYGLRIRNRRVLRKLRGSGFFLYGNHTQALTDAFAPSIISFPRKAHIVAGADAVSIPGLRYILVMLGVIPLPTTLHGMKPFSSTLGDRFSQKRSITVYPEAHIWPYYTGIRPFGATSFAYPAKLGAPCVAMVTTYRERRIFKKLPPLVTITLSEPFYPDRTLAEKEARQQLRDSVYAFMCAHACSPDNAEYIRYVQRSADDSSDSADHAIHKQAG